MSINRLSHLTEGEKIYLEVTRRLSVGDDGGSIKFQANDCNVYLSDDDTFYFPDDLKQLANDGMPKQGEMIDVFCGVKGWRQAKFICNYGEVIIYEREDSIDYGKNSWRFPSQKTELTLAEVEERLGLEKGSLIIK